MPALIRANHAELQVAYGSPRMVPLRQIADFKPAFAERQIERRNLQRLVQVWSGVASSHNVGEVSGKVQDALKKIDLPPGYQFQFGGQSQDMAESLGYALAALAMGVIFIYLILASQFGSFLQPVAIMASLPLSLIGVFIALLCFRSTLNLFSVIGFIMLMGLVTKNAILLIDFTNHARREGKDIVEAIYEAGQIRLRPILMTTGAMIGGMIPLALALGAGSEQQSPMAHAVIGGIIIALVGLVLATATARQHTSDRSWLLPLLIFLGSGAADIGVTAAQRVRTTSLNEAAFTTMCFGGASLVSAIALVVQRQHVQLRDRRAWMGGIVLGSVNYASLLFLILALGEGALPASSIFPLMNIAAILFATMAGMLIFKERLSLRQWIGIACCIIALVLIMSSGT